MELWLLTHAIVEAAKALGGSYASAKNCKGDDSTAQGNIKEWGHTNQKAQMNIQSTNLG